MQSTIQFDISDSGDPVISFSVVLTDDVRDRVAVSFFNKLKDSDSLKIISTKSENDISGLIIPIPND